MSWQAIERAMHDPRPQTATAQHVLLILANFADKDGGSVYPSLPTVARFTRLSLRAVRAAVSHLRDAGVLEVKSAILGKAIEYQITPAPNAAPPRQIMPTPPAPAAVPPRQNLHMTPAPAAANPIPETIHINPQSAATGNPDGPVGLNGHGKAPEPPRLTRMEKDAMRVAAGLPKYGERPAPAPFGRRHDPPKVPPTEVAKALAEIAARKAKP